MEVLFLSSSDLEKVGMSFKECVKCCERSFIAHGQKKYEMPPKPGVHSLGNSFIHAMPGYLEEKGSGKDAPIGIKWIAGYPDNPGKKLPTITGLMVLNDAKTGLVKAVMDGAFVTNIRTAAATCATFKKLGDPSWTSIGLCGAGMQGKWNVIALSGYMNIKKIKVFDKIPAALEAFKKLMAEKVPGAECEFCDTEEKACRDVDCILAATGAQPEPFLFTDWVKPGCLIFPIHAKGWNRDALKKSDIKFVVDDYNQFKNLTGGWYDEHPEPYAQTGEILSGAKQPPGGTVFCVNTGLGLHDLTTADRLLEMIQEKGMSIGQKNSDGQTRSSIFVHSASKRSLHEGKGLNLS
eukprot:gnl/TRDRNA2_/TRDRNA2_177991_c3_seq4.p1 gnl/TRDRNA2_/TRDRNA2_177991_c3~~gnl/TRDRNA2_/TRDRNA2_177991_c3_seq4.p1  ORF type:complete len:350 (-),score=89.45 gnl/TRDRNA2_/TRDRNA2_177991_c3_seq4:551-1600(-)